MNGLSCPRIKIPTMSIGHQPTTKLSIQASSKSLLGKLPCFLFHASGSLGYINVNLVPVPAEGRG